MAMDINKVNAGHGGHLKGADAKKVDATNSQQSRPQVQNPVEQQAVPKDSVSLTQQAQSLGQMQRNLASTPSFNQDKVATIKKALAEGQYNVDPEKLAQKLHAFEEDLGNLAS